LGEKKESVTPKCRSGLKAKKKKIRTAESDPNAAAKVRGLFLAEAEKRGRGGKRKGACDFAYDGRRGKGRADFCLHVQAAGEFYLKEKRRKKGCSFL